MPTHYSCTHGHFWEDVFDFPSIVDGQIRCPVCGHVSRQILAERPARADTSILYDSTGPHTPSLAQTPAPAGLGATIVFPKLAGASAPHRPDEADTRPSVGSHSPTLVTPITPSRFLDDGQTRERPLANPDPEAFTVEAPDVTDWPCVPGYEILGELGRGGMGVVYKAHQQGLNRIVALKMVLSGSQADERDRSRFRTEAEAIARLVHPHIVQIYGFGEHEGAPYFSLEYVEGGSLADRIAPRDGSPARPLPVTEAAALVELLARAIHVAHASGVVHRDLKPANILLQDDVPKITDFGLARKLDQDLHNTRSGMIVGTPGYIAPEQAVGSDSVGPAADTYALGVILYQLVAGKMPFSGVTPMDVLLQVTQDDPPPPSRHRPGLARDLETIILKCLEKDPARRYGSALDLAEDLRRFLAHEPILARPVAAWERAVRWVRRRPTSCAVYACAVVAVLASLTALGIGTHAEQKRRGRVRGEIAAALRRAEEAAGLGAWEDVRGLLEQPRQKVGAEPALADFAGPVEQLAARADGKIQARRTLAAFAQARDDALFHDTLAAGGGSPAHLEATRQKTRHALGVVGAAGDHGPLPDRHFTDAEQGAIREGCFELLLVLAEATASSSVRDALAVLDTAAGLGLQTHAYHLRRARYLEKAGRTDLARAEADRARKCPPKTELDHYLVGGERYRQGDMAGAERAFIRVLGPSRRGHFWATYFLALCHVRQGQMIAARDNLTNCLHQHDVVWIRLLRGFVQGQLRCYDEAERDFDAALGLLAPADRGARYVLYNNRAVTRIGQQKFPDAEKDLLRAVELAPDQYQAFITLSQVYARQPGKETEARQALDRGLVLAKQQFGRKELDAGTLVLLHRLSVRLTKDDTNAATALADLDQIVGLPGLDGPSRAGVLRDRGHLLYRGGNLEPALAAYDQAAALAPEDPELHRWRGEVLVRLKRFKEAVVAFDRHDAAGGKPTPSVFRGRALARASLGEHEAAIRDLTRAIEGAPRDASLFTHRGRAYLACQAGRLAGRDFDAALELDGGHAPAYHGRALVRLLAGQPDRAARDAEEVVRLAPNDGRQLYAAACVLAQAAGQTDDRDGDRSRPAEARRRDRRAYLDRAADLLGRALLALRPDERLPFWADVVDREQALRPLGSHPGFTRLTRIYRAPPARSVGQR